VHTSIDIIEEKLNIGNKTTVDIRDLYLGLLFATEEYKMCVIINYIRYCKRYKTYIFIDVKYIITFLFSDMVTLLTQKLNLS